MILENSYTSTAFMFPPLSLPTLSVFYLIALKFITSSITVAHTYKYSLLSLFVVAHMYLCFWMTVCDRLIYLGFFPEDGLSISQQLLIKYSSSSRVRPYEIFPTAVDMSMGCYYFVGIVLVTIILRFHGCSFPVK